LRAGAPLFAQHCASCHRFRDSGGNIGPNPGRIESRPIARVVEDILDPSRNIDPAFRVTALTLKSGETKSGLNFARSRAVYSSPTDATGETIEFPRTEITEIAASTISAMPAAFDSILSEQELFDLIAYLRSAGK
jgi:putative heme-binding domain-containing protein